MLIVALGSSSAGLELEPLGATMENLTTHVGLDVHKTSISICALTPNGGVVEWKMTNGARAAQSLRKKLRKVADGSELSCCYEAGPMGVVLQRKLVSLGVPCVVIAPSLIPVQPGRRVKTDRRDARQLAELFRAGLLTEIRVPTEAEEAARDLCRAREQARSDLMRARHRLQKFLLRRGLVFCGGTNWTARYWEWANALRFESDADRWTFETYTLACTQTRDRVHELSRRIELLSKQEPFARPVAWLRCFRGIDTTTAMVLVTELHDVRRFTSAPAMMAYLGLTPSEHSSGDKQRRGRITKTGNRFVRKALVEAAWHYRRRPSIGRPLTKRREGQPGAVIAIADKAAQRLHRRSWKMLTRGKPACVVNTTIARELVGFLWAVMQLAEGEQAVPAKAAA